MGRVPTGAGYRDLGVCVGGGGRAVNAGRPYGRAFDEHVVCAHGGRHQGSDAFAAVHPERQTVVEVVVLLATWIVGLLGRSGERWGVFRGLFVGVEVFFFD